jgi:hypothetical protein
MDWVKSLSSRNPLKSPLIPNPLGRGSVFDLEENTLAFADFLGRSGDKPIQHTRTEQVFENMWGFGIRRD